MLEIIITVLFFWLFFKAVGLAVRMTWGFTRLIASVLFTVALPLLLGCLFMIVRKIITWHIPVSILGTVALISGVLHYSVSPVYADPISVLCSGGLMLGACFMATDYVTSPMVPKGQIIYGIAIGALTVVIRNWGSYPEGMSFAILIMNAFTPLINTYCKPRRFGEVIRKEAKK
jgi:electron transport complex protein RnfD